MYSDPNQTDRRPLIIVLLVVVALAVVGALAWMFAPGGSGSGHPHAGPTAITPSTASSSTAAPETPPSTVTPSTTPVAAPPAGSGHDSGTGHDDGDSGSHPATVTAALTGPLGYRGVCPATLEYSATITVSPGSSSVSYHWNDGTATGEITDGHVTGGTLTVTRSLTLSASGTGTISLSVDAPAHADTASRTFTVQCSTATTGAAETAPLSYSGTCTTPELFTTYGLITVDNGPVTVSYRWMRSDGSPGPVQTVSFGAGHTSQYVHDTWTLGGPGFGTYHGWEQLQILSPSAIASTQSNFTLTCS